MSPEAVMSLYASSTYFAWKKFAGSGTGSLLLFVLLI